MLYICFGMINQFIWFYYGHPCAFTLKKFFLAFHWRAASALGDITQG